ncbi:hypothetical protein EOJ36_03905 [Sandaracinomonas limnophila]|uniref:Uncharacterized protein n=1 Tax=Sandaracinomonas limnophila TaxID=1862386 RepID=A0A437PTJ3_9BACT|nr:hypothetical protein [Sandaracinomonas limnophila]RVU25571.1 hypothetical protein EOJ36_03905 [Sandaracinomonas limnophila]
MRITIILIFILFCSFKGISQQKLDDFGRIVLTADYPENKDLPHEARQLLLNKLQQVTSNYGLAGTSIDSRFVITAKINVLSKDLVPGPPAKVSQKIEINFIIADLVNQTIFSNTSISSLGIGTNENQSYIDAFKRIDFKNVKLKELIEEGKNKIISYYLTNCDFILKEALIDTKQGRFDKAIYDLSIVPEVCQQCYFKSLDTLAKIYQRKIDTEGLIIFKKANAIWASGLNIESAEQATELLGDIPLNSSAQKEAKQLVKRIEQKLRADQKARWEFKLKQYNDKIALKKESMRIAEEQSKREAIANEKSANRNFELDKMRINSYREVAVTYAKNQPKQITTNRFIFLR